jgi:hypothetical protein
VTSLPLSSGTDGSSPRLRCPRKHDASLGPRVATHLLLATSRFFVRDIAAGFFDGLAVDSAQAESSSSYRRRREFPASVAELSFGNLLP